MNWETFINFLCKKLAKDLPQLEEALLNAAIKTDAGYKSIDEALISYTPSRYESARINDKLSVVWEQINSSNPKNLSRRNTIKLFTILKVAAVFIIVAGVGLFWFNNQRLQSATDNELIIFHANNKDISTTLPDGSHILLSKNSSIKYHKNFGEKSRDVQLEGRAYFDVRHNATIPFIADAGNVRVLVKGTVFTITQNNQFNKTEVALLKGIVEVSDKNDQNNKLLLHPGQMVTAMVENNKNVSFVLTAIPVQNDDTASTSGAITFDKEKLKDLAVQLERKYKVKIDIKNNKLKEALFTGVITHETLSEALDALKSSYSFTFTIRNENVVIE